MKTKGRAIVLPASVRFAFIAGLWLLIEGVWELFNPVVFGVITSNPLHGMVHLCLALAAIWSGRSGHARGFLLFFGAYLLLVSSLWYFSRTKPLIVWLFNMNHAAAYAHAFAGVLSLIVATSSPGPRRPTR